jgi:glycoprotein endo-alpha-1,2-mannosidase
MESGLAAYWDFDTIAGDTISDLTPNGNDGIIYGGATLVESEAPVGFIPPVAPVGLRAYGGEDYVQLAWKPADGEIESYHIYRGDSLMFLADGSSFLTEATAHDSTFTDSTTVPGENYYYCLRSSDGNHLSHQSSVVLGRTLAVTGGYETGVYYYPWYGPLGEMHEWDGQYTRDYLIPRQPPMLGHYSSRDPMIIRQHLNWMETCGIDFMVMSWWGIESREDITLRDHILGELADTSLKFSIYYESARLGLDQGQIIIDESNEGFLVADFNYIADTYFEHPNYLRINDKPVIFIYLSGIYSGNFKEAFTRVRNEMSTRGFEVFLVGDEVGWDETSVSHMEFLDAVSPYIVLPRQIQQGEYPGNGDFFADLSVQAGKWEKAVGTLGKFVIPSVIPGFNNRSVSGSGFAVPRQTDEGGAGTSMLEEYIKVMLPFIEPEHKMVMITSWNEWHEDTQVEPTIITLPTVQDVSAGGDYYSWNYTYEGYGFKNLEVIRRLLASELPETDFTTNIRSSINEPGELEIYPNPASFSVTLRFVAELTGFPLNASGTGKTGIFAIVELVIYDAAGRLVECDKLKESAIRQGEVNLDVSGLPDGLYLCQVLVNNIPCASKKLVIAK